MNIIGRKYFFLAFSGLLVLASIAVLALWGLRLGIDFTGGTLIEVEFAAGAGSPSPDRVRQTVESLGVGNVAVQPAGERGVIIRAPLVDEPGHQRILLALRGLGRENLPAIGGQEEILIEKRFDSIGPVLGSELKRRSLFALCIAAAAIVAYIAWAFRKVSEPVASWKYGVAAVLALVHDVLIPTGLFAVLGRFAGVEADALFVTALLTIMGFSVHDTIVVFDRIRENLRRPAAGREHYADVVNKSVNQTIARSVNTSLTVLLVLGAIFFAGGETTRFFALALAVGILAGTYSSIFIASPLVVVWHDLTRARR